MMMHAMWHEFLQVISVIVFLIGVFHFIFIYSSAIFAALSDEHFAKGNHHAYEWTFHHFII